MARVHPHLREPSFEAVAVGEPIGPFEVVADEHFLKAAAFAVDDYSPWYFQGDPAFGGRIVPSTKVVRDLVALFCEVYDPSRVVGLHQKEEVWFAKPIRLGTRMLYTGRYTDKYMRRGKGYTVFECEARDAADGSLLVRQISIEIMRIPDGIQMGTGSAKPAADQAVSGIWPQDREIARVASADVAPGTPVTPLKKTARQDQMSVFSGADRQWYNIHTDVVTATEAGFRDTLAQGAMETCWTSEMLAGFFGPSWLSSGWIRHAYLKPVYRGDTITCRGVVTGSRPEGARTRIDLEVWCENQDGLMTAAGWASGLV